MLASVLVFYNYYVRRAYARGKILEKQYMYWKWGSHSLIDNQSQQKRPPKPQQASSKILFTKLTNIKTEIAWATQ